MTTTLLPTFLAWVGTLVPAVTAAPPRVSDFIVMLAGLLLAAMVIGVNVKSSKRDHRD